MTLLPLLLLALQQGGAPAPRVQMGVAVQPETVTVGDPFRVTVRVRAPAGATIEFPAAPDSGGAVEALETARIEDEVVAGAVERRAIYRLVAWDVGRVAIGLPDVVVRLPDGTQRAPLGDVAVQVRSVLPQDSALRVPKPPRPPIATPVPWWAWAAIALAALALLALLVWLWRRLRRRRGRGPALVVTPYDAAQREFARIEGLGLVDAGERGRYAALMADVLREYLAGRIAGARLSLTSRELVAAVRDRESVPAARLEPLLREVDEVKFARRPISAERAREVGREARSIVADVERT